LVRDRGQGSEDRKQRAEYRNQKTERKSWEGARLRGWEVEKIGKVGGGKGIIVFFLQSTIQRINQSTMMWV